MQASASETTRTILHVDMDAFFVSVEEVRDPSLRGRPVVVGGDPDGRGVVAAASYAARRYGIHSAMPLARAKRLCPGAVFLRGAHGLYREFSERIFALLDRYSPAVEPMSLDEAYVDLTGCERLHGPGLPAAERIRNEIRNTTGIPASIGIATNKLVAKIASGCAKPNGMLWIVAGRERKFLAPLPLDRMPGIGPRSGEELRRMGIRTLGDLAALPRELLEDVYGRWGTALYFKARGVCDRPVLSQEDDPRSISRETTLETDSVDAVFLESTLSYLVEKAAAQLRGSGRFTRSITLKLRYSDFKTVTRSRTLREPAAADRVIYRTAVALFRTLFTRRTRVRLIGVQLAGLTPDPCRQAELFDPGGRGREERLSQGIDRIRRKYGFRSILRGRSRPRSASGGNG